MNDLEKKLKDLQNRGYENIGIHQVLQWIADIKRDNRLKSFERKYKEKEETK